MPALRLAHAQGAAGLGPLILDVEDIPKPGSPLCHTALWCSYGEQEGNHYSR